MDKTDIDPDNLQKVWREIEIMRQLAHRHIIQLYQVGEEEEEALPSCLVSIFIPSNLFSSVEMNLILRACSKS